MTISVTAEQQGFTRPGFSAQFFQTPIGNSGSHRNADHTLYHQHDPMNPGGLRISALPAAGPDQGWTGRHCISCATKCHGSSLVQFTF